MQQLDVAAVVHFLKVVIHFLICSYDLMRHLLFGHSHKEFPELQCWQGIPQGCGCQDGVTVD